MVLPQYHWAFDILRFGSIFSAHQKTNEVKHEQKNASFASPPASDIVVTRVGWSTRPLCLRWWNSLHLDCAY